eukprot:128108-Rhodomonas_salina.1
MNQEIRSPNRYTSSKLTTTRHRPLPSERACLGVALITNDSVRPARQRHGACNQSDPDSELSTAPVAVWGREWASRMGNSASSVDNCGVGCFEHRRAETKNLPVEDPVSDTPVHLAQLGKNQRKS